MRDFVWEGTTPAPGFPDVEVRVEINTGEAVRFGRHGEVAFDDRGRPLARHSLVCPGIDELFCYFAPRKGRPRPRQAFVLGARVEQICYAFSLVFDPFDGKLMAESPAAATYRAVMDVFLGGQWERIGETPLVAAMEAFFGREDCLEDRRELILTSLSGERRGETRRLFVHDPDCGFSTPWERVELPLAPAKGLTLLFEVRQNQRRVYVDRLEETEARPAADLPVVLELPTYKGTGRRLTARTDAEGRASIRVPRLGNVLRKRFILGDPDDATTSPLTGWLLVRPPGTASPGAPVTGALPGPGSRSTAADLTSLLLADLAACYDPDVDSYTDPVAGNSLRPTLDRAAVLEAVLPEGDRTDTVRRFLDRARRQEPRKPSRDDGDEDVDSLGPDLVRGVEPSALESAALTLRDRVVARKPGQWTEEDIREVLEMLVRAATLGLRGPALVRPLVGVLRDRLSAELEPTYYYRHVRRPIKTFAASSDPVAPHGWAILALSAAEDLLGDDEPGLGDLAVEQADHVASDHGYYDTVPDIVAHGRKEVVDLSPLLSSAMALKLLALRRRDDGRWAARLADCRAELFRQYRDHYPRLSLNQRFEMLRFTAPGVPPWFDDGGRLVRWRRGGRR